jgi:hypothetical protein
MEDRNKLVDKLRYIANQIERNKLDYRYAWDRILLDDLYNECQKHFNNYLKVKNEIKNKVKPIKFFNNEKSS